MRTKQMLSTAAVFSAVFVAGCAGSVSLADSEAGFQASSQSGGGNQSTSENSHMSQSQNTRQAENQGGTGSTNSAHQENSSEAVDEAGRPGIAPHGPAQSPRTTNAPPTGASTNHASKSSASRTSAAIPHEKTTTYNWGRRKGHHTHTNRSYMVNTIHEAARTK